MFGVHTSVHECMCRQLAQNNDLQSIVRQATAHKLWVILLLILQIHDDLLLEGEVKGQWKEMGRGGQGRGVMGKGTRMTGRGSTYVVLYSTVVPKRSMGLPRS